MISPQVLGSKVDLFIRGATPLRSMESDVVERLVGEMEAAGISIVRGEAEAISGDAASKTVVLKDGKGEHGGYGQVLFATGREPVPARTSAAPRLHLGLQSRLHLGCTSASLRPHLGRTSAAPRPHLGFR